MRGLGVSLEALERLVELVGSSLDVSKDVLLLKDFLNGARSRASDGVSGVSSTERTSGHGGHDLLGGSDTRERETVGETLGKDENVGLGLGNSLNVEESTGSSETRLNLVGNEEDVVLVADLSEVADVSIRGGDVTSFSQDRLDEDGGCKVKRKQNDTSSVAGGRESEEPLIDPLEKKTHQCRWEKSAGREQARAGKSPS